MAAYEPTLRRTIRPTKVIAIIGPAQAGKTTIASELQTRYGFQRFRFADTLKNMIMTLGCSRDHVDGDKKEVPLALLCGKTARHALQTLGTEWRNMIGKDLWAVQTVESIAKEAEKGAGHFDVPFFVAVDDMRFVHEQDILKEELDTLTVRVWDSRKAYPYKRMWLARRAWGRALMKVIPALYIHESEAWWNVLPADAVIDNCGTLDELYQKLNGVLMEHQGFEPVSSTRIKIGETT